MHPYYRMWIRGTVAGEEYSCWQNIDDVMVANALDVPALFQSSAELLRMKVKAARLAADDREQ
jgi:hypothetical protein